LGEWAAFGCGGLAVDLTTKTGRPTALTDSHGKDGKRGLVSVCFASFRGSPHSVQTF
jgi:hypothetical protein